LPEFIEKLIKQSKGEMNIIYQNQMEKNKNNKEEEKINVLTKLFSGEWIETQRVEKVLNITFEEGMRIFDFKREVEWNPAPLNGQKISTYFKIKNRSLS
jgi:hypothetical protein